MAKQIARPRVAVWQVSTQHVEKILLAFMIVDKGQGNRGAECMRLMGDPSLQACFKRMHKQRDLEGHGIRRLKKCQIEGKIVRRELYHIHSIN